MKKSPTVFLIICLFVCLFLFLPLLPHCFVSAYDAKTTHPNLTEITVDFYNSFFSQVSITDTEKQWLMQGSINEDEGIRSINHFYDPIFNKTWQFGGIEYLFPSLTAKEWAQNPFAQAFYDPIYLAFIGPVTKSPVFSRANFTWQKAVYEYAKGNKKMAFESLGHILHLIQDMSVPEHTRANAHISFIGSANSSYELYTAKSAKSFYEQTKKDVQGLNLVDKASLNEYFDEIALYSNNYFYSPDTFPPTKYKLPEIIFPDVAGIGEDGITRYYFLGNDEEGTLFHLAKKGTNWRAQSGLYLYTLEDNQVLEDYWQRLSKKAVLNGTGVINLFFKEVEKAKSNPDFISKNEKNVLTAMIGGITGFINDIFQKDSDFIIMDDIIEDSVVTTTGYSNSMIATQPSNNTTTTKQTTTTIKTPTTTTKLSTTTTKPTTTTTKSTTTTTTKLTTTTTQPQSQVNICNFITFQTPLRNKIIINEVAWMGTQNSANDEWIELKNVSSQEINLSNWQLLDKDEQIKVVFQQSSKIPAYGFYLLERTDDDSVPFIAADYIYVGSLANQNEDLRLFDNSCQLEDEALSLPDWSAGDNSSKRTMERKSDFTWQTSAFINGTPKQENSSGYFVPSSGSSTSSPTTTTTTTTTKPSTTTTTTTLPPIDYPKILINEIKIAGKDEDAKTIVYDEFIELFNPNEFEVDLTGWYLQKKTSQSSDFSSLVPSALFDGEIINSLGYLLIVHSSSTDASIADILISNYSITDNNTIILKDPNREIVDKVGFGEANDCEASCAINPEPGQSIERKYINGNFLDSDNNANDFEVRNCPSPKSFSSNDCLIPTTIAPPSPAIPYITEFSWHPFDKDSSKIVIDFRINSYPFIPPTNYTDNVFTAMAFYLHSDLDDSSSDFGIPTDYLGGQDSWSLGDTPALVISYPNCQGYTKGSSALVFTNSESWCHAPGGSRGLSYNWWQLPKDNHFLVNVTGITNGQSLNFTPDQYITIGYYGYANSPPSYLKLIAYDNTKFYFDSSNYYHKPTNVKNFEVECNNENCNNLIFSWTPASDEDPKDILKYDIHYVFAEQGDDLNNNDLMRQSWEWSSSYNVLGESIFNAQTNKFQLQVSINDIYYINAKRLPGVPLDVFFGIKAQDSEGLKSEIPKIFFINIPPIVPETTTTTAP